ncbi:MAG: hypothetical protein ABIG84_01385 [archaeon]
MANGNASIMMNLGDTGEAGQANVSPTFFPSIKKTTPSSTGIPSNITDQGIVYMPAETVQEYVKLKTELAEYKGVEELYAKKAKGSRSHTVENSLSFLDNVATFEDNYFVDWVGDSFTERRDALQKLGGWTPLSEWYLEKLPIYKGYRAIKNMLENIWKGAKPGEREPAVLPGGGMVWDAEKYWDFVRFIKENYTDQFVEHMERIKETENPELREEMAGWMDRLGRFYYGLIAEAAIPFTAESSDDIYRHIHNLTEIEKDINLSRKDYSTPREIEDYRKKVFEILGEDTIKDLESRYGESSLRYEPPSIEPLYGAPPGSPYEVLLKK